MSTMPSDPQEQSRVDHAWHVAINRFTQEKRADDFPFFMYDAKKMWREVPYLTKLFGRQRRGELPKVTRHCSFSPEEAVPDNHLTCCLGVKCHECPFLLALESAELTPEQIDEAKAWTCASHIAASGGDRANEGFILTVDDRMFWDRTYASMAESEPDDAREKETTDA